jgi:drug/metabolite transporter (DMT)-like permease
LATQRQVILADLALFGIAVGWGYTFVLTKDLLNELPPLYFQGTRFLLAGLVLMLWLKTRGKRVDMQVWKTGSMAGFILFLAYTFQLFGLDRTTPGKAGMITGLAVVIVPFLYVWWSRSLVPRSAVVGSLLAFTGLSLLSWDGTWNGFNTGDVLVFFCAIAFAVHMVMVDRMYEKDGAINSLHFAMVQLITVGVITLIFACLFEEVPRSLSPYGWFAYLFDLIVGTLLAYVVQLKAQRYTPPTHVSLILSLESMFAFFFSWLVWGESLTSKVLWGAALMLAGIVVTEMQGDRPEQEVR